MKFIAIFVIFFLANFSKELVEKNINHRTEIKNLHQQIDSLKTELLIQSQRQNSNPYLPR